VGNYDRPHVINMPALPKGIGSLIWRKRKDRNVILWRQDKAKKIKPEATGAKRPQAILRKPATARHGLSIKLLVDCVEVQAPALHIASSLSMIVQLDNIPMNTPAGHHIMREILRKDDGEAAKASDAMFQAVLRARLSEMGKEPIRCNGLIDDDEKNPCPHLACRKSSIAGSENAYCSATCQVAGDDREEAELHAKAQNENRKATITYCASESLYDNDTLGEKISPPGINPDGIDAHKADASLSLKQADPVSCNRIRPDSVYKAYIRGVESYILFPQAAIWREPQFSTFLTSLADVIVEVVDQHGYAKNSNRNAKNKDKGKMRFEGEELQKHMYSNIFSTLLHLKLVVKPSYEYFNLINTKILLPGETTMGGDVTNFATELSQSDKEDLAKASFPATEASIVDSLKIEDFHADGGGQKSLDHNDYCICGQVEMELFLRRKNCSKECISAKELTSPPLAQDRRANINPHVTRAPVQLRATCLCGNMYYPSCGVLPKDQPAMEERRNSHRKRAEDEVIKIRKDFPDAFIVSPFKWDGLVTGRKDLLEASRLCRSKKWGEDARLFSKEQECTDTQLHAPVNAALLEELMASKSLQKLMADECDPDDPERLIEDKDMYDENCPESASAISEASAFIAEPDVRMIRTTSLPNLTSGTEETSTKGSTRTPRVRTPEIYRHGNKGQKTMRGFATESSSPDRKRKDRPPKKITPGRIPIARLDKAGRTAREGILNCTRGGGDKDSRWLAGESRTIEGIRTTSTQPILGSTQPVLSRTVVGSSSRSSSSTHPRATAIASTTQPLPKATQAMCPGTVSILPRPPGLTTPSTPAMSELPDDASTPSTPASHDRRPWAAGMPLAPSKAKAVALATENRAHSLPVKLCPAPGQSFPSKESLLLPLRGTMAPPPNRRPSRPSSANNSTNAPRLTPMSRRRDPSVALSEAHRPPPKQQRKGPCMLAPRETRRQHSQDPGYGREHTTQHEHDSRPSSRQSRNSTSNRSTSRMSHPPSNDSLSSRKDRRARSRTRSPRSQAEDTSRNASRERWNDNKARGARQHHSPERETRSRHSSRQASQHSQGSSGSRKGLSTKQSSTHQAPPRGTPVHHPGGITAQPRPKWAPQLYSGAASSHDSHRGRGS
jgi:hypothetical protein